MIRAVSLSLALLLALACGGGGSTSTEATTAGAAAAPAQEAPPAAAAPTTLPPEAGSLQIDLPEGASASVMMGSVLVSGGGLGGMNVGLVKDGEPKTLDEVKKDIEMYTPTNLKEETLADGFVVTFENTGSMGTNYWARAVRTVGDKTVSCSATVVREEQRQKAVAACKSIRQ